MKNIQEPRIAIVLLNYCNYQDTINCIHSLSQIKYTNYYIVVVDNCSPNESIDVLQRIVSDKMFVLSSGKNGGFAFGNNYAIEFVRKKGFDFVLLLNNDTLVEAQFLKYLVNYVSENSDVGIFTSRIMYYPEKDKIWCAGGKIDWNNLRAVHYGYNEIYSGKSGFSKDVNFASGCCMLIPREVIENVGKLPEEYFMYYEDLDYCVDVVKHGYKIQYVPESIIYHCVSNSSGGLDSPFVIEWSSRSRRKFYRKYKNMMPPIKREVIWVMCEVRTFLKILFGKNICVRMKAYFSSFLAK